MERDDLDVNIRNGQAFNALHILCKWNAQVSSYAVQQLIQHGADINATTTDGFSALALLCRYSKSNNQLEVARSLVNGGIDAQAVTENGDNALTLFLKNEKAASSNLLEMVNLFVAETKVSVNHTNQYGENALHLLCSIQAIESDQMAVVTRLLISNGIDINASTLKRLNALHLLCRRAVSRGMISVARLLLEGGIYALSTTKHGNNALTLLCTHSDDKDMVEMTRLLVIESKLDINHQNKDGNHALLCLCSNKAATGGEKQLEVARLLIANGCDVTGKVIRYRGCQNVLDYLFSSKRDDKFTVDMARVLIEAGTDVNEKGKDGDSMLQLISKFFTGDRLVELVHLLMESGFQVEEEAKKTIPLLWSRRQEIPKVLDLIQFIIDSVTNGSV